MTRCLRVSLWLWVALGAAAPARGQSLATARPEAVGLSSRRLARVHAALQAYVDRGEVAGVVTLIARRGKIVELDTVGFMDVAAKRPMRAGTLFRIASMTKPVTSVAVMMLYEEGRLLLSDPVSRYIPAFQSPKVAVVGAPDPTGTRQVTLVPAEREITILDLLTHRSGLTYGFADAGPVGDLYRKAAVCDGVAPCAGVLADNVARLAAQPLVQQPGTRMRYGLSTDVLGRLVEVVSGQTLDRFFQERIFKPLRMNDTYFYVPDEKLPRLAVPYTPQDHTGLRPIHETEHFGNLTIAGDSSRGSRRYFSGGAGLVSTARDYARFLQMLLNGGELDGVRLLSPKTVQMMTVSHTGAGFGLGFGVTTDLRRAEAPGSAGSYWWGGIYGTTFWVDPKEQLIGVLMIQLYPNSDVHIGDGFRVLAYQAITK